MSALEEQRRSIERQLWAQSSRRERGCPTSGFTDTRPTSRTRSVRFYPLSTVSHGGQEALRDAGICGLAVGFVGVIGGVITALSTQLKVAYGRHQELDRPPSEADLIPPRLHSLSRRPGHTSVKLTRRSCSSPRIEACSLAAGPRIFPIRSLRSREFSFGIGSCAARLHRRAGGAPPNADHTS